MFWKIKIVAIILILSSCQQEQRDERSGKILTTDVDQTVYLIEANHLKEIVDHPNIKLIDFRKQSFYEQEHMTGALNIWRSDIEDSTFPYGGMMASPLQMETLLSSLGITNEDTLIIYDDNGLCDAARLWWILQNYDFTNVKLLNGGLTAWKDINGVVTIERPAFQKTDFKITPTPSMKYYLSKENIKDALDGDIIILDTRTPDEFSGKRQKNGAAKGGRIPKSINIDWSESVNYSGNKRFKSIEELESIYSQFTSNKEDTLIVYCHSGVRSAHTTFVLTQMLGYQNVKNYDGSWAEWSYFDDLVFIQDSITTLID